MNHGHGHRKLGRTTSHRLALLRSLLTEFLDKEKIVTTVPKAKELRPLAEKMITLGKRETLHARRQALSVVRRKAVVHKLFETLAPRFVDRNGGYTRIIRLGFRKGDDAELALIELLGSEFEAPAAVKKGSKKAKKTKEPANKPKAKQARGSKTGKETSEEPAESTGRKASKEAKSGQKSKKASSSKKAKE